jgi:vacuolar-type H+-ATPase subunit I/STV1
MRIPFLFIPCSVVLLSCNNNNPVAESNLTDSVVVTQDKTAVLEKVDTALIAAEMKEYKARVSKRIEEYDTEISKLKKDRDLETDQVRKGEYSSTIQKREENKKYLQERLGRFGDKMNNEWAEFRNDLQRFFDKENVSK